MNTLTDRTLCNRYYLRELVGSGGMADVYLAWDKVRSAKMAIKVLRRDLSNNQRFIQQFHKEADVLRELDHPNIVRLYEFESDDEIAFIVMEWVEGSNLRQIIQKTRGNIPLATISRILESVCSALHYAHGKKIYHCDIKPANIMLHVDGKVLLTDFGVAHLADETGGGGTPPYMAPEQFTGESIDGRTDIYSLGVSLYEILTAGKTPFRGLSNSSEGSTTKERIAWEHLYLQPPSLSQHNPQITPSIERVVHQAMQKEPDKRYQSTLLLKEAFDKAISSVVSNQTTSTQAILDNLSFLASSAASAAASKAADAVSRMVQKSAQSEFTRHNPAPTTRNSQQSGFPSLPIIDKLRQAQNLPIKGKSPSLFFRSGQWAGQSMALQPGETIIGRGSQSQIKLSEGNISRRHATIIYTKRGVYIRDDGSNMGTFVNGNRINALVLLHDRDVIQIGYQQVFEFRNK